MVDLETKSLLDKCLDDSTLVTETLKKSNVAAENRWCSSKKKIARKIAFKFFHRRSFFAIFRVNFRLLLSTKHGTKNFAKDEFIELHSHQALKYFLESFLINHNVQRIPKEEVWSRSATRKWSFKLEFLWPLSKSSLLGYVYGTFCFYNTKVLEKSGMLTNTKQRKNVEHLLKYSRQLNKKRKFKDMMKDFLSS